LKKYLQNKIAESPFALPIVAVYAVLVWLLAGLLTRQLWLQFAGFVFAVYMMVELTNRNALLRVRSRMVSCSFLLLSCILSLSLGSITGVWAQVCLIGMFILLCETYQQKEAQGMIYYAFLLLGLASLLTVSVLVLLPVLWVVMLTQLQSFNWRSWLASVFGTVTPYWLLLPWLVYRQGMPMLWSHFEDLFPASFFADYVLTVENAVYGVFMTVLLIFSAAHFWQHKMDDSIRIRQFYGMFIGVSAYSLAIAFLRPDFFDVLIRIVTVCVSPLLAHFAVHKADKVSNILFFVIIVSTVLITVYCFMAGGLDEATNRVGWSWNG